MLPVRIIVLRISVVIITVSGKERTHLPNFKNSNLDEKTDTAGFALFFSHQHVRSTFR